VDHGCHSIKEQSKSLKTTHGLLKRKLLPTNSGRTCQFEIVKQIEKNYIDSDNIDIGDNIDDDSFNQESVENYSGNNSL
jgi:hypothetical protein